MAAKVELNCEMTCDNCANKIRKACDGLTGITIKSIDVTKQQVLLEVAENADLTIPDLQSKIEGTTGLRTVIKGVGEGLSTVSEFNGPDDLIGVIRLAQLSDNQCLVDGVIDRIKLSSETNHCCLDIHEFGDLRNIENVGSVKIRVLDQVKPIARRCLFRGSFDNCDLNNVIGRSLVIKEKESDRKLSAAIIARVSPIYGNDKKICSCSGIVRYTDANLLFKLPPEVDKLYQTTFIDHLLEKSWTQLHAIDDLFLFKFNQSTKKTIPGKYKFLKELNVGRAVSRRQPQLVTSLTLPFDENKFNFNKIKPQELLFKVIRDDSNSPVAHVMINNSPIEYCSSLMVIDPEKCLPQRLTSSSLQLAIEFCALGENLRMGFNSLGAQASVNHCHWHVYHQKDYLYLQSVSVVSENEHIFTDYPLPGFMFEITSAALIPKVVSKVMKLVDHAYTQDNHAYNLFITRSHFNDSVRVFIWIRKACFGSMDQFKFNSAFLEFSGLFVCKTEQSMEEIDQNFCTNLLKSIQIDSLDKYRNLLKE